ncbi:hypothetical protein TrRE_jg6399, partial [Triparma retinervis]
MVEVRRRKRGSTRSLKLALSMFAVAVVLVIYEYSQTAMVMRNNASGGREVNMGVMGGAGMEDGGYGGGINGISGGPGAGAAGGSVDGGVGGEAVSLDSVIGLFGRGVGMGGGVGGGVGGGAGGGGETKEGVRREETQEHKEEAKEHKGVGGDEKSPRGSVTNANKIKAVVNSVNPENEGRLMANRAQTFTPGRYQGPPKALFDVPCPGKTDGNPVCACQIKCDNSKCARSEQVCSNLGGCAFIDFNEGRTWATLKRGPSDQEMDIFDWEGNDYTMGVVEEKFGSLKGGDGKSESK